MTDVETLQLLMTYDKPGTAGGGVIEILPEELQEFCNLHGPTLLLPNISD